MITRATEGVRRERGKKKEIERVSLLLELSPAFLACGGFVAQPLHVRALLSQNLRKMEPTVKMSKTDVETSSLKLRRTLYITL